MRRSFIFSFVTISGALLFVGPSAEAGSICWPSIWSCMSVHPQTGQIIIDPPGVVAAQFNLEFDPNEVVLNTTEFEFGIEAFEDEGDNKPDFELALAARPPDLNNLDEGLIHDVFARVTPAQYPPQVIGQEEEYNLVRFHFFRKPGGTGIATFRVFPTQGGQTQELTLPAEQLPDYPDSVTTAEQLPSSNANVDDEDFVVAYDTDDPDVLTYIIGPEIVHPDNTVDGIDQVIRNVDVSEWPLFIDALTEVVIAGTNNLVFDLNGDGVVNQDDRFQWVVDETNTFFGDSNLDGEFSSEDFVAAFQSAEYEDGDPMNSDWSSGDWNGDGDFTSADLTFAFEQGGYEIGPRPIGVPEPTALVSCVLGVIGLHVGSRRRRVANT